MKGAAISREITQIRYPKTLLKMYMVQTKHSKISIKSEFKHLSTDLGEHHSI